MIAPQGLAIGPARLEPHAGARNMRNATVKKRRNSLLRFLFIIRKTDLQSPDGYLQTLDELETELVQIHEILK